MTVSFSFKSLKREKMRKDNKKIGFLNSQTKKENIFSRTHAIGACASVLAERAGIVTNVD